MGDNNAAGGSGGMAGVINGMDEEERRNNAAGGSGGMAGVINGMAQQGMERAPGVYSTDGSVNAWDHRKYGGSGKASEDELGRLGATADGAIQRAGYQYNDQDYNQAQGNAAQARGQQMEGLGMLRGQMDTSRGTVATDAIRAGSAQAQGVQNSLAGLARGGLVGQRAAASQAYNGNLNMGQQAAQQAAIVRADEAQRAGLQYGQAAAGVRGGDDAARGLAQGYANQKLGTSMTADEQNAQRQRGFEGMRGNIYGANMRAAEQARENEQTQRGMEDRDRGLDAAQDRKQTAAYFNMGASALETWSNQSRLQNTNNYGAGSANEPEPTKKPDPNDPGY